MTERQPRGKPDRWWRIFLKKNCKKFSFDKTCQNIYSIEELCYVFGENAYLLDEEKNMELMREEFFTAERFRIHLKIENYASYLIKFVPDEEFDRIDEA